MKFDSRERPTLVVLKLLAWGGGGEFFKRKVRISYNPNRPCHFLPKLVNCEKYPMAKEDFCFTYYDGDAARDKAHMNRLERGAYDDIISAQRKFGHLTKEIIKKVLGNDFDACWTSIELILALDSDGRYFIEWVEKSVLKAKEHSKKQSERIKKYWDGKRDTTDIPRNNHGNTTDIPYKDIPLEDGNGDGDGDGIVKVLGKSENPLTEHDAEKTVEFCKITLQREYDIGRIRELWAAFLINNEKEFYNRQSDRIRHFRNWIKTQPYKEQKAKKPVTDWSKIAEEEVKKSA